MKYTK